MAQGSFHTEPHTLKRGDCDTALAAAPHRLEGEFLSGGQEHFYLETHAAWAEPGEAGTLFVSSSTQHPSEIQTILSEVLAVPRNKIVVQAPRMGGAFGGKEVQGNTFGALVALAAVRTGRPVRMQLDRDLDMMITGKRHPFHSKFSAGFDDEGRLLAARVSLVSDGGWSLDLSQPILDRALFHLDNVYYIPHVHFTGRVAKTNVDLPHRLPRFRRAAGDARDGRDRGPRGARRSACRPSACAPRTSTTAAGRRTPRTTARRSGTTGSRACGARCRSRPASRARGRRSTQWNARHARREARHRGHGGEVRHLLHARRFQPGRRACR